MICRFGYYIDYEKPYEDRPRSLWENAIKNIRKNIWRFSLLHKTRYAWNKMGVSKCKKQKLIGRIIRSIR
jgi:hypothetical protein